MSNTRVLAVQNYYISSIEHQMVYSTCFNPLLLLVMMQFCIAIGSGTYIPRQGGFLGYTFTKKNPIRFDLPSGCSIDKLKDIIKQVAPMRVPPYGIHESQVVRRLFFRQPGHVKCSKKLIEYEMIELKNDKDVLKVLVESNYWKDFAQ